MTTPITIAEAQAPAKNPPPEEGRQMVSAFATDEAFQHIKTIGNMFSQSALVPKTFQGPNAIADCVIAVNMANRMGADPLMVMQNLYIVHGKPAWSGQFVIATINASGYFVEPINFEFVGTEGQDDWGCYASGITKNGTLIKGPTVTIGMAKAEGWHGKNPKWRNMPELMLRYRAGAFFGKSTCPELLMGFKSEDEVRDIIDIDAQGNVIHPVGDGPTTVTAPSGGMSNIEPVVDRDEEAERCKAEVEERGFYSKAIDGAIEWFNAAGQRWDAELHALSSATEEPIINADGAFKAKRVYKKAKEEETVQAIPADDGAAESGMGLD